MPTYIVYTTTSACISIFVACLFLNVIKDIYILDDKLYFILAFLISIMSTVGMSYYSIFHILKKRSILKTKEIEPQRFVFSSHYNTQNMHHSNCKE